MKRSAKSATARGEVSLFIFDSLFLILTNCFYVDLDSAITALLRDGNIIHGRLEKNLNWTILWPGLLKKPARCCRRQKPEQAGCRWLNWTTEFFGEGRYLLNLIL